MTGQERGHPQSDGDVSIMAAGMHKAIVRDRRARRFPLADGNVHVKAEQDDRTRPG